MDVKLAEPAWSGTLHFVLPIEPWDGGLGEGQEQFQGEHCGHNWIKFSVGSSGYRFAGDFRFFQMNHRPNDETLEMYDRFEKSYRESKDELLKTGTLAGLRGNNWVDHVGGEAPAGNWSQEFRSEAEAQRYGERADRIRRTDTQSDGRYYTSLSNANGSPFQHIGNLTGWRYRDEGVDRLLLFFDPIASQALIVLDFS
jgi:hypothetical protein